MRVSLLRRFGRDEQGNVFLIAAVSMMALVGLVGISVDVGRAQLAQSKLQSAIDAAGLAAGSSLNSTDLDAVAEKYVNANFAIGTLGAHLEDVDTKLSDDKQIITISARANIDTTFMRLFDEDSLEFTADTEITRTNKGMELALVLDTTGSMEGSKLTALKSASHDLLDILFGDKADAENLWVGVVPFSQAVNIGTSHVGWINETDYVTLDWGPTSWAGCVEARWQHGRDITDAVPATESFEAYYWADQNSYNNWIQTGYDTTTDTTTLCGPNNKDSCRCTSNGGDYNCKCNTTASGSDSIETCTSCSGKKSDSSRKCVKTVTTSTPYTKYVIDNEHGPNKYCPSNLSQLSNLKKSSSDAIDALVARGNTHVSEGAAWGYRLLSPNWRGLWGGAMDTNNLPLNYNSPLMVKAVIIMTDGENTISNSVDGAYGYLSQNQLGTTDSTTATTKLNDKVTSVCNAMKAQGILVYTILFEENKGSVVTLMKNCATTPDYFFNSPDEDTLKSAFHTIGDSLANLRISR